MANVAASTKLGQGFGPLHVNGGPKVIVIGFATTATLDVLIFDASNVTQNNRLGKVTWADIVTATGALTSLAIVSNQITVGMAGHGGGATNVTALVLGY